VSDPCDLRQRVIAQPPKNVKTREKVHKGGGHFTIRPEKCQAQPLRKSRRDVRGYINHKISTRSCHKISTSISHQSRLDHVIRSRRYIAVISRRVYHINIIRSRRVYHINLDETCAQSLHIITIMSSTYT
jgi:hypothetical protein